jgi:hypothetical protein
MIVKVNVENFILFHKERVSLLNEFIEKKIHRRLIYQVSFLGFESLARVFFPNESVSEKRFKNLLNKFLNGLMKKDIDELYHWRCSLIHEGFIALPYNTLEGWGESDRVFLSYPDDIIKESVEYDPEAVILMYNRLILCIEDYFKENNIKEVEVTWKID